jgi:hypothetical protein
MISISECCITIDGQTVFLKDYHKKYNNRLNLIQEYASRCSLYNFILTETLIDKFFKILEKDSNNISDVIDKIHNYATQNRITIDINIDNTIPEIVGHYNLNRDIIYVRYNEKISEKLILLILLHELSHYITHKSAPGRLIKFIKEPPQQLKLDNLNDTIREIEYLLSPNELANWAFSLALEIFQDGTISLNDLINNIQKNIKQQNLKYYDSLNYFTQTLFKIHLIMFSLKYILKIDNYIHRGYEIKLNKLLKLIDKYIKRLCKLFGTSPTLEKRLILI